MKIMIIEDNAEELKKAEEIVRSRGHEVMLIDLAELSGKSHMMPTFLRYMAPEQSRYIKYSGADGIITDLNFHMPRSQSGITPSGLILAFHAALFGKPAVICTRVEEGDSHHGENLSWIFDGYFIPIRNAESGTPLEEEFPICPGWVEKKDWEGACEMLEKKFATLQQKSCQE